MPPPMQNSRVLAHTVSVLDAVAGPSVVDRALQTQRISRHQLDTTFGYLPYAIEASLVEAVAHHLGDQDLGARGGLLFEYSSYKSYADYVLNGKTLATAFRRARRALPLLLTGADVVFQRSGEYMLVRFDTGLQRSEGRRHIEEGVLSIIAQVPRHFLGGNWHPSWVEITDAMGARRDGLEDLLNVPVRGPAMMPAVAIRISDLHTTNPSPSGLEAAVTLSDLPSLMGVKPPRSMSDAVVELLRAQLVMGAVSEESVAEHLDVGPRKLQRVLLSEGTSYREIREEVLKSRAQELLIETDFPIDAVALSLGYFEPNSFRRAFRKWTGHSPSNFRDLYRR